jgi:hypothetical protein
LLMVMTRDKSSPAQLVGIETATASLENIWALFIHSEDIHTCCSPAISLLCTIQKWCLWTQRDNKEHSWYHYVEITHKSIVSRMDGWWYTVEFWRAVTINPLQLYSKKNTSQKHVE